MSARAAARLESLGFSHVYRYVAGKVDWLAFDLPSEGKSNQRPHMRDLARRDAPTCGLTECLSSIRSRLSSSGWDFCVVVDDQRVVHGLLPLTLSTNDDEAWHIMDVRVRTFRPYADLKHVADAMRKDGLDLAVITNSDGQLLGAILRSDVEKAIKELNDTNKEVSARPSPGDHED